MKKSFLQALVLISVATFAIDSFASTRYISVGTGSITGVYYPAGGAICRLLNRGRKEHGIRCSVESTGGSVSNLNAIRNGAIDFGIVQSDWQYHAFNGSGFFSDQKPFKELRSVFSLYTETFTMAVSDKSDIKKLDDIVGKRVNFGPQGSGMYATMEVLMAAKGWTKASFAATTYLQPSEQPKALCDGKIDVMIYAAGNPNGVLQEATQTCKTRILSVDKETIDKLIKSNSFYVKAIIPGGMYAGNQNNIETFGVKAGLVTSEKVPSDVVYNITKAVFENFDNFKTLHPVFSSLKKEDMIKEGQSAPIHPGAERYFKEAGLSK
ncbi:MAG: TAXI family TRAP transporter solute-binding subunit [Proteobacteria bacterium]|nr:TAXI family TRAP transporter solute-binding subunit [Pseudomonadota bacterium]